MEIGYSYCVKSKIAYERKIEENFTKLNLPEGYDSDDMYKPTKLFEIKKIKKEEKVECADSY